LLITIIALLWFSIDGIWAAPPSDGDVDMKVITELAVEDTISIGPEKIIETCSRIIASADRKHDDVIVIQAYDRRAQALTLLGKNQEALVDYDTVCAMDPTNGMLRCHRARVMLALGERAEALRESEEGIRLAPEYALSHTTLALAMAANGRREQALTHLAKAIELDPHSSSAYYHRASLYFQCRDCSRCLTDISRFIELRPFFGLRELEEPYVMRGTVLLWLHRPHQALADFLLARNLNRKSANALWGAWSAYYDLGHYAIAAYIAEEFIDLDPKQPLPHIYAALSYMGMGMRAEALKAAEDAAAISPRTPEEIQCRGRVRMSRGEYAEALREFDAALLIDPHYSNALLSKSFLLSCCPDANFRNGPKARELASESMDYEPGREIARSFVRAASHAECGDFEKAIEISQASIKELGDNPYLRRQFEKSLALYQKRIPLRAMVFP
jgi:tetratricopeptide (TPR) repeat protein